MRAETLARFRRIGGSGRTEGVTVTAPVTPETPTVTPVTPVTPRFVKFAEAERERHEFEADALEDAIAERRALLCCSELYRDAFSRLNHVKPAGVLEPEWRLALNDGGLFLDRWSKIAEGLGWTPAALFDVGRGLVWQLAGERVEALGPDHARLSDGRTLMWEDRL